MPTLAKIKKVWNMFPKIFSRVTVIPIHWRNGDRRINLIWRPDCVIPGHNCGKLWKQSEVPVPSCWYSSLYHSDPQYF